MVSKSVSYEIQMEINCNNDWFGTHVCKTLPEANKKLRLFRKNSKGDSVMIEMKTRFRIRKVTEEVLVEYDVEA